MENNRIIDRRDELGAEVGLSDEARITHRPHSVAQVATSVDMETAANDPESSRFALLHKTAGAVITGGPTSHRRTAPDALLEFNVLNRVRAWKHAS